MLHSPEYRTRFASDLKKILPRLPFTRETADFWRFSQAGRDASARPPCSCPWRADPVRPDATAGMQVGASLQDEIATNDSGFPGLTLAEVRRSGAQAHTLH